MGSDDPSLCLHAAGMVAPDLIGEMLNNPWHCSSASESGSNGGMERAGALSRSDRYSVTAKRFNPLNW